MSDEIRDTPTDDTRHTLGKALAELLAVERTLSLEHIYSMEQRRILDPLRNEVMTVRKRVASVLSEPHR